MAKNIDQAEGRLKKAAGELTNDPDMHREGRRQETAGKVKEAAGKVKNSFDRAVDKVKDASNDR